MRMPAWLTWTRVALLAIVVLAAAMRLWHIGDFPPGLYPDEATNGNDVLKAMHDGHLQWFYPNNGGREGLFLNLQGLALYLTGVREPWVLRLVAALVGIATIPGMYLLGRELWNRRTGLIAAALLAGSFWHLVFSRIGFRAIMAPLMLVYGLALFLRGMRAINDGEKGAWWAIVGGAIAGLGFHTYIAFRLASIAFVATGLASIFFGRRMMRTQLLKYSAYAGIAALIVAAPLLNYFRTHPGTFSGRASEVSVMSAEHPLLQIVKNTALEAGMIVTRGDGNWRHNFSGQPEIPFVLLVFLIGGVAWCGRRFIALRGRDVTSISIASMLVAGALPAILSNEGLPHALRSIMLVIPVMLLAALGLERALAASEKRGWRVIGMALVIGVVAYGFIDTGVRYVAYVHRPEVRAEFTASYVEAGRKLLEHDPAMPIYVVVPHGNVMIDGIPVAAQTTMFISGTEREEEQRKQNSFYITNSLNVPFNTEKIVLY